VDQAVLTVGGVPALAADARRYRLECAHGATWAVVLPGRSSAGDSVAVAILITRHAREVGCRCAERLSDLMADPAPSRAVA
jgi:hypothetical protein